MEFVPMNTKTTLIFTAILMMATMAIADTPQKISFGEYKKANLWGGTKRKQSLSMEFSDNIAKPQLMFTYEKGAFQWGEIMLGKVKLVNFKSGTCTLRLKITDPSQIIRVLLHFQDNKGESFRFKSSNSISTKPGQNTLVYKIDEKSIYKSWGKNGNKKFNFPLYLKAVDIILKKEAVPSKIFLEDLIIASNK
jgi:hypothetical protein